MTHNHKKRKSILDSKKSEQFAVGIVVTILKWLGIEFKYPNVPNKWQLVILCGMRHIPHNNRFDHIRPKNMMN